MMPLRAGETGVRPGDRVLFLGDSIMMDGRYIAWLDLMMRTRTADPLPEFINLGLASETLSGLSEPEHPWPRPCVFERLDRALEKVKPQVVVACYGMNDGIYAPPSEERRRAFERGCRELSAKVKAAGALLILVTPPPFDAASFNGPLKAETAEGESGYTGFWKDYDQVLSGYAAWMRETPDLADRVFDLHTPLRRLYDAMRAADPAWKSGDGVHPDGAGHLAIACLLAEALELPPAPGTQTVEREPNGTLRLTMETSLPLPVWRAASRELLLQGKFSPNGNVAVPAVDLTEPVYRLKDGDRLLGIFTSEVLQNYGAVDFALLSGWRITDEAEALLEPAMRRQRLMSGAWREHVGHTRPDTDRNYPPLEEARKQAAPLEAAMRQGALKRKVTLRLEPVR